MKKNIYLYADHSWKSYKKKVGKKVVYSSQNFIDKLV